VMLSIRQHTSAYVSIRQHTSAYVSIRQHTSAYLCQWLPESPPTVRSTHTYIVDSMLLIYCSDIHTYCIYIHTVYTYILYITYIHSFIHTYAHTYRRITDVCMYTYICRTHTQRQDSDTAPSHTSACVSICQHTSAYVRHIPSVRIAILPRVIKDVRKSA
jgi:hypothetical protein